MLIIYAEDPPTYKHVVNVNGKMIVREWWRGWRGEYDSFPYSYVRVCIIYNTRNTA